VTEHTPEPFGDDWMDDETPLRIPEGKKLVCYLVGVDVAEKLTGPLVVAAPDLLAALEAFMESTEELLHEAPDLRTEDSVTVDVLVWFKIKAAIAKARGEKT
jgi:hypothetical protein